MDIYVVLGRRSRGKNIHFVLDLYHDMKEKVVESQFLARVRLI